MLCDTVSRRGLDELNYLLTRIGRSHSNNEIYFHETQSVY